MDISDMIHGVFTVIPVFLLLFWGIVYAHVQFPDKTSFLVRALLYPYYKTYS